MVLDVENMVSFKKLEERRLGCMLEDGARV